MDKKKISALMKDLESNKEKLRGKAFNILLPISQNKPEELYPEWDRIIKILNKEEVSNKYVAIHLIANFVRADKDEKFEKIFNEFYGLLKHESPVVSPYVAGKSGRIINAKPKLQKKIVKLLLTTDKNSSCRHKELLKAYVIDGFDECLPVLQDKNKIFGFVEKQIDSGSPKTKKRAKDFMEKFVK